MLANSAMTLGKQARKAGLSFRPVMPSDIDFLSQVYRSTREEELAQTGWDKARIDAFLEMQFQAQHQHYQQHYQNADWLIIQSNAKDVGRFYIEELASEYRVIDIALLPEARGHGMGHAILSDTIELASSKGRAVGIHVEKTNPAISLYRRLGFTKTEDKGVYDLMHWRA